MLAAKVLISPSRLSAIETDRRPTEQPVLRQLVAALGFPSEVSDVLEILIGAGILSASSPAPRQPYRRRRHRHLQESDLDVQQPPSRKGPKARYGGALRTSHFAIEAGRHSVCGATNLSNRATGPGFRTLVTIRRCPDGSGGADAIEIRPATAEIHIVSAGEPKRRR